MAYIPHLMLAAKTIDFVRSIAGEVSMETETSVDLILRAYLKNLNNLDMLVKQIERKGSVHRILVIGQTGAGKSSLVNLLAGKKVAKVSDGAKGCTFQFETYQVDYNGEIFELIDTVGLNEGSAGTVKPKEAMKMLIKFIKGNKRGFSCILFVMPKGRITDSFEKNHMLFYQTLLHGETPSILFLGHCESDDPMDTWIKNEENKAALMPYNFSDIVCGTAQEGGRFAQLVEPLRNETCAHLWESITEHMLEVPRPIEPTMHLFKQIWNSFCDFVGINWKFLTDQFASFLEYLKGLGVDQETLEEINRNLH
jgi:GTP-binding protein EngB required for normal cell division